MRNRIDVRSCRSRRGAAVVEMALILPVFIAVVLGIIEFGRAMTVSQLMVSAAREGARLGIVGGTKNADVEKRVRQFASDSLNVPPGKVHVDITVTPAPGNPSRSNVGAAETGDLVTVEVRVPFDEVSFIHGTYMKGKMLHGQVSMRHE